MTKSKMRDLVVLLPGITGSVLKKDGEEIWAPSVGALCNYIRSLGDSVQKLRLPPHEPGKPLPDDGVCAVRLIRGFHGVFGLCKIDGYQVMKRAIIDKFDMYDSSEGGRQPNFVEFPYDWRRSNRESAEQLRQLVEERLAAWRRFSHWSDARAILIAHSMGGLVSRYYLEVLEGWRDCRALITFGTPYWGAVNAINYVANGYKQKFMHLPIMNLTEVLRSMPSVYELMACYDVVKMAGRCHKVASVGGLPNIDPKRAADALQFHDEIDDAVERHRKDPAYGYEIFPIVGVGQPTLQSVEFSQGRIAATNATPASIDDDLAGGDGTVPRVSATPIELFEEYRGPFFVERHGCLQNNPQVLDNLVEVLKSMQSSKPKRGTFDRRLVSVPTAAIGLDVDDLYLSDEPVRITVTMAGRTGGGEVIASIQPESASGGCKTEAFPATETGTDRELGAMPPGRYRITISPKQRGPGTATPVHDVFEVAETT